MTFIKEKKHIHGKKKNKITNIFFKKVLASNINGKISKRSGIQSRNSVSELFIPLDCIYSTYTPIVLS